MIICAATCCRLCARTIPATVVCGTPCTWTRSRRRAKSPRSNDLANHVPVHIRQPPVDAVMAERQARVVDAKQVQNGGMDIVHLREVAAVGGLVAPLVARAEADAALDAAAGEPV